MGCRRASELAKSWGKIRWPRTGHGCGRIHRCTPVPNSHKLAHLRASHACARTARLETTAKPVQSTGPVLILTESWASSCRSCQHHASFWPRLLSAPTYPSLIHPRPWPLRALILHKPTAQSHHHGATATLRGCCASFHRPEIQVCAYLAVHHRAKTDPRDHRNELVRKDAIQKKRLLAYLNSSARGEYLSTRHWLTRILMV